MLKRQDLPTTTPSKTETDDDEDGTELVLLRCSCGIIIAMSSRVLQRGGHIVRVYGFLYVLLFFCGERSAWVSDA